MSKVPQTGREHVDLILNDIEKAEVQRFIDNPTMVQAVKKVLLKALYFEGVLKPGEDPLMTRNAALAPAADQYGLNNEQLGAKVRAMAEGIGMIDLGFNYLENYKTNAPKAVSKENPGR